MCGRFALRLDPREIRQIPGHDSLEVEEWLDEDQFVPRYNIAPRSQAPVLRRRDPGSSNTASDQYILQSMKWGLVPNWSKFEDKSLSTTNARSENLVDGGGMWAGIKGKKRCAVLCQGYYEWLTKGKDKLPHFTKHQGGKLMLMAGLYDCVALEGQAGPLWTFTIVTTSANKDFEWLHDRQPVILSTRAALDQWLDTSSQSWTSNLNKLVEPYNDSSSPLDCYQVPKEVGKVGTESSTFIEPVSKRKDGIEAMFSKQKSSQKQKVASTIKSEWQHIRSLGSARDLIADPALASTFKKRKAEQMEFEEGPDLDIVSMGGPSMPKKIKKKPGPGTPTKTATRMGTTPNKARVEELKPEPSPKITTFFRKA